ncbi:hypothetical protein BDZ89DRAFT_1068252 [Hymenopellis radicata]|nr:hypothetical protein BDZ89DRAFT_1068252 [Hymenopellis radicata]
MGRWEIEDACRETSAQAEGPPPKFPGGPPSRQVVIADMSLTINGVVFLCSTATR